MTRRIRTLLADDHPLFRNGVARTLEEAGDIEIVAQCGSADDAVAATSEHMPDVALLDISMPGNGITAATRIGTEFPAVRVIMLTVSEQDDTVMRALEAGASGYVLKGVSAEALIAAVRGVHAGGSYISPELAGRVLSAMGAGMARNARTYDPVSDLTRREEQILRLVARGCSNREIGEDLSLQEATVKHYMTNILQKLQVRNRVEAALLAREEGM
ncbi:response regulator [Maliponia aquimaris]|uniref:Transcriptional regulatory protein DegU n=1 Tax=Maliponia aquimaris TaxID=1673631 RepID=A0A238KGI8_9RHOB|nr:response regulator transcription factor [Maliponia aquimaris]SMX41965.1 Transcriptional regulatory protein DegU [Maliponia aquimaris]